MTSQELFVVASYETDGTFLGSDSIADSELDVSHIADFAEKLGYLSGDLELPVEDHVPGEFEFLEYRIASDLHGAYALFYFHDEVIFASLMLSGTNEIEETELMQVFKYLLLDTEDIEEPTEEDIDAVLSSTAFDFPAIEERPVVYEVQLVAKPEEASLQPHVTRMNRNLAAAFFAIAEARD